MNRVLTLITIGIIALVQVGLAQEITDHKLAVRGKTRVFAKADRAKISFEIKGVGSTLALAFADARTKLADLTAKLKGIGLEDQDLSTSFFRSEENYGNKAFLSSKRDYRAIMSVTIVTDKLDLIERLMVAISEGNVESISDVSFELTNYGELRKNAIQKATEAAEAKARLVAEKLGVVCGTVLEFEELPQEARETGAYTLRRGYPNPFNTPYLAAGIATDQTGIYPEEIQFDAEVRIVYAIQSSTEAAPSKQ